MAQWDDRKNLTNNDYNQMHQQSGYAHPPPPGYAHPPPPAYAQQYAPPPPQPLTVVSAPTTNVVIANAPCIPYVPDYMGWSIFNLLICFLPLGLVAIIFSAITRDHRLNRDMESARRNSRIALGLNVAATVCGIIAIIVFSVVVSGATNSYVSEVESSYNNLDNDYISYTTKTRHWWDETTTRWSGFDS